MKLKGTKIYSIFTMTCPRCHEGELFKNKKAYSTDMMEMNESCPNCGEDFSPEPGFYYGAAYVSYALTVALWVSLFVALTTFDAIGLMNFSFFDDAILFLVLGVVLLIVLMPLVYRLSRSIWINFFVKYREDAKSYNAEIKAQKAARKKQAEA
jgi:uncharacterized protein (DUF983 family)